MAKRFQEGGLSEAEPEAAPDIAGLGALSLDPSTVALMSIFGNYTTPEAQSYSKRILDQGLAMGPSPESEAVKAQKAQTQRVRDALKKARETLMAQDYNRGDVLLAASAALGQPTRTGSMGESIANAVSAMREPIAARRKFGRERDSALSELDLAEAQADTGETNMAFQIEQLQRQLHGRLEEEALKNLGKSLRPGQDPRVGVLTNAAKAIDDTYAKQYLPFIQEGAPKVANGIGTMKFAAELLRSGRDNLTGPFIGGMSKIPMVGRFLQEVINPTSADVRDLIEQTVQEQLRPILGSQFTEKEGERLIARLYNPALDEWRNARRIDYFVKQIERAYQSQIDMANYWEKNHTLSGFKGKFDYSTDDFDVPDNIGTGTEEEPDSGQGFLSPAARASLLPGSMMGKDADEGAENERANEAQRLSELEGRLAKGGRVGFQGGGIALAPEPPKNAPPKPQYLERFGRLYVKADGGNYRPATDHDHEVYRRLPRSGRHFQEGGGAFHEEDPVMTLSAGEPEMSLAEPNTFVVRNKRNEEENQASDFWDKTVAALGFTPFIAGGGAAGLGLEEALSSIQRRLVSSKYSGSGREYRRVSDAMKRAGIDPIEAAADVTRGRRAGVPQQLMDVDAPGIQVLNERALAYGGKEATEALENLRDRVEGSRDRVQGRLNVALKPDPYFAQADKFSDNASNAAREALFQPVYKKYPTLPADPVMTEIIQTPMGKKALAYAKEIFLNQPNKGIDEKAFEGLLQNPSLEYYDAIRRGFDKTIMAEERKAGKNTEMGDIVRELRTVYTNRLDRLAPGDFKTARKEYAGDLEINDALRKGKAFRSLQPEQLADIRSKLSFHEVNAFRTGMAQDLYESIMTSTNPKYNAAKALNSPELRGQLKPFFDNPKAEKLFWTAIEREANLVESGTKTIRRGEASRLDAERKREEPGKYAFRRLSGLRYAVSMPGWIVRLYNDLPKLNEKQSAEILKIMQTGDPQEMQRFARTARRMSRLDSTRGVKRAAAIGLGAAAGAAWKSIRNQDDQAQRDARAAAFDAGQ